MEALKAAGDLAHPPRTNRTRRVPRQVEALKAAGDFEAIETALNGNVPLTEAQRAEAQREWAPSDDSDEDEGGAGAGSSGSAAGEEDDEDEGGAGDGLDAQLARFMGLGGDEGPTEPVRSASSPRGGGDCRDMWCVCGRGGGYEGTAVAGGVLCLCRGGR